MRNIIRLFTIFVFVLVSSLTVYGQQGQAYEMRIPEYRVRINGEEVDNIHSTFPILTYKGVLYIPIDHDTASRFQLSSKMNQEEIIIQKSDVSKVMKQDQSTETNVHKEHYGMLPTSRITINDTVIDNESQMYPIFLCEGIPYIPLTWEYAVQEFGFTVQWDPVEGVSIFTEDYRSRTENKELERSYDQLAAEVKERQVPGMELNGYYAISSYDQFNTLKQKDEIKEFDSLSFGWAQIGYDSGNKGVHIQMKRSGNNAFSVPNGYQEIMTYLQSKKVKTYLNIYADQYYDNIFAGSDQLIQAIGMTVEGKNQEYPGLGFDGVVIDFENLPAKHKEAYVGFLTKLNQELDKKQKGLHVAVQPRNSYTYGEIVKVADKVIVMLHDYESKSSNGMRHDNNVVYNPITPIEQVKRDLMIILNQIDRKTDASKLQLQLNFAVSQWRLKDGQFIHNKPFTPQYKDLISRIYKEQAKGRELDSIIHYSEPYENPYVTYEEDGTYNTIWYEDSRSVQAKIDLAQELGLGGISIWRIGTIPEGQKEIYMNVWEKIKENKVKKN